MELATLKKLVRQGEGQHLEFKLKATHPEKIVREMVAFANSEGGKLLIGVADNKHITGLKFPNEDKYALEQALQRYCTPMIEYFLEEIPISEDKTVLLYDIQQSTETLHYVREDIPMPHQTMYVRADDKSLKASKEVREVWKGKRKHRNFQFQYGDKEKLLLEYLEESQKITVNLFAQIANIPKRNASRTLVLLVLAGILEIYPQEKEDYFMRKPIAP